MLHKMKKYVRNMRIVLYSYLCENLQWCLINLWLLFLTNNVIYHTHKTKQAYTWWFLTVYHVVLTILKNEKA